MQSDFFPRSPKTLAPVLIAALGMISALTFTCTRVAGQTLRHDYDLRIGFFDLRGGNPLVPLTDFAGNTGTLTAKGYELKEFQGLRWTPLAAALAITDHYSIEMRFQLETVTGAPANGFRKLIDLLDRVGGDCGLYQDDGPHPT